MIKITKAAITPGTHPQSHKINTIKKVVKNNVMYYDLLTATRTKSSTDGEANNPENCPKNALWVHSSKAYEINEELTGIKIQLN